MQTHRDEDAIRIQNERLNVAFGPRRIEKQKTFMEALEAKAAKMVEQRLSEITSGKPGEVPLGKWDHDGVHVCQLPDDEQGILRISIGGGDHLPVNANYCVFRGKRSMCIHLLRKALAALEA